MEHPNESKFYLWRCALANLLGASYLFLRIAFIQNLREASVLWTTAAFAIASVAITAFAIRTMIRKKLSRFEPFPVLIACLLSFVAAQRIYTVPMPAQIIKQEFVALICSGFAFMSAGRLMLSRRAEMEPKQIRHAFLYGSLIPFFLTLFLMSGYLSNLPTTVSLCAIVSLYCLGGLFFFLSVFHKRREMPAEAEEEGGEKRKRRFRPHVSPVLVTLFGVLFPIAGLTVNARIGNVVTNFSSPWYYIIALVNGFSMLASAFRHRRHMEPNLAVFFLKCAGAVYVAYFALILIPFMPFGVVGLIVVIGILILTPLILLAMEIWQLVVDYKALCERSRKRIAIIAMVAGFALLPVIFTGNALCDRVNYHRALSSISPVPQEARPVDAERLNRAISMMSASANANMRSVRGRFFDDLWSRGYGENPPILSFLYGQIVFSNEPLAKDNVERLLDLYFSGGGMSMPDVSAWNIKVSDSFRITSHNVRTTKDVSGAYRSWVDLEIKSERGSQEFKTEFSLPNHCFVTDYYLFVGLEKKQGILSERAAANQIYESIVNQRRDPGKLCYTDSGDLSLRIFPFASGETRRTGIELLHAEPLTLTIDGVAMDIGFESNADLVSKATDILNNQTAETLPYDGNAYLDAAILTHNTKARPEGYESVVESFKHRVLTPRTCFLALESMEQENALRFLQTQVMNGETIESIISMDEPWIALMLPLLLVALMLWRRYNIKWLNMIKR